MKPTAWKQIRNFLKDEEGASAVEYGIMLALIIAICVAAIYGMGQSVKTSYETVDTRLATPR